MGRNLDFAVVILMLLHHRGTKQHTHTSLSHQKVTAWDLPPGTKALGAITISEACLGCITQQEENPNSGGANQPGSLHSCAGDPRPSRRVQQGLGQLLEHNGDRRGFPTAPAPEGFGCRNIFPPLLLSERREKFGAVWFGSAAFSCFSTSCSALEFKQQAPTAPGCHLQ